MECKNDSEYQRKAAEELSTSEQLEFADRRELPSHLFQLIDYGSVINY